MDSYAVVGNPVNHSKSPFIHTLFAEQTGQLMAYSKIEAPLDDFKQTVINFFSQEGGKGLNVTVPFKEQAWAICQARTERAELSGAVNTLFLDAQGRIKGDNTDGVGLVSDLKQHGVELKSKKILIVGAGGAVRGVLQPILKEMPEKVCICNRTVSKAERLASIFRKLGKVEFGPFEQYTNVFDLVINGTSASLTGELPPISRRVISSGTTCYDMMYSKDETVFNKWAREQGAAETIDGLGMLVEQAAEAFHIWRGKRPNTKEVLKRLRSL